MNRRQRLPVHNTDPVLKDRTYPVFMGIALITLITYAVIFTISPINGEDFALGRKFTNESFALRLESIAGRSLNQIQTWNARLGEQLAIFWLSWPRLYFTLAAVAAFAIFNFLLATIASDGTRRLEKTAISMAIIFALWPGMELFFWGTANAGYLQPLVLFLVCIYFYRNEPAVSQLNQSTRLVCLVSLTAFFAGLSFETVPIAVLAYLALTIFFCKEKLITWKTVTPLVTMAMGWALLVTAPSTFIRRAYYAGAFKTNGYSYEYLITRFGDVLNVFYATTQPLLIAYAFAIMYLARKKELQRPLFFFLVTGCLTIFSVSAAPYTEPRAFSLAWALMYAVVLAGVVDLMMQHWSVKLLLIPILVGLLYFPSVTYFLYSQFADEMNTRDAIIRYKADAGECKQGITVKSITTKYEYRYLLNRDEWYKNSADQVGYYYNCKIIVE